MVHNYLGVVNCVLERAMAIEYEICLADGDSLAAMATLFRFRGHNLAADLASAHGGIPVIKNRPEAGIGILVPVSRKQTFEWLL